MTLANSCLLKTLFLIERSPKRRAADNKCPVSRILLASPKAAIYMGYLRGWCIFLSKFWKTGCPTILTSQKI